MKNLHVLPTDKPSRLGYIFEIEKYHIFTDGGNPNNIADNLAHPRNIYITNDELPKLDVWGINTRNSVVFKGKGFTPDEYDKKYCRKIILTTDQELIKKGVQAIDDEFLEWFVENPSCEEVDFRKEHDDTVPYLKMRYCKPYKIIIPKEEPKKKYKVVIVGGGITKQLFINILLGKTDKI